VPPARGARFIVPIKQRDSCRRRGRLGQFERDHEASKAGGLNAAQSA
jgi:hypothetical protein